MSPYHVFFCTAFIVFIITVIDGLFTSKSRTSITPADVPNGGTATNYINGVSVLLIDTPHSKIINNEWEIDVNSNSNKWGLRVALDSTWNLDASSPSAITMDLYGYNKQYSSNGNLDLLLTIELRGQNYYSSIVINLDNNDNNGNNLISPICDTNLSKPTASMIPGDPYNDMNNNNEQQRMCDVMRVNNICIYNDMLPSQINNIWPLRFTVKNYPNSGNGYSIIEYRSHDASIQTCAFNQEIKSDAEIEFWITTTNIDEIIRITQIDLESFQIDSSTSPTRSPTTSTQPTAAPTNIPTNIPTYNPSAMPSNNPSITPSNNPSMVPSNNPSMDPSYNPSMAPSYNPSVAPLMHPVIVETNNPSMTPSNNPSITPTNNPSMPPSYNPSMAHSNNTSIAPSMHPAIGKTNNPSVTPSNSPIIAPTNNPSITSTSNSSRPDIIAAISTQLSTPSPIVKADDTSKQSDGAFDGTDILYIVIALGIILCICCIIVLFICCNSRNNAPKYRPTTIHPSKVSMTPVNNIVASTASQKEDPRIRTTSSMINNYLEGQGLGITPSPQKVSTEDDLLTVDYQYQPRSSKHSENSNYNRKKIIHHNHGIVHKRLDSEIIYDNEVMQHGLYDMNKVTHGGDAGGFYVGDSDDDIQPGDTPGPPKRDMV